MSVYIHMTAAEQRQLAEKQANGERLTSRERSYLMQKQQDAQGEGRRLAGVVQADNAKAIDAATPGHLKRPRNLPAEALALYTAGQQFQTPELKRRIAKLREEAAAREKEIDAETAQRAKEYAIQSDPSVQDALRHCDSVAERLPELADGFAELRGLLEGGGTAVVQDYWRRAVELTSAAREKTANAVSKTGVVLNDAEQEYMKAKVAFERANAHSEFARDQV